MVTLFLCDDNEVLLSRYQEKLTTLSAKLQEGLSIITFTSGENLVNYIENHPTEADVLFLDVLMGGISGIETGERLRALNIEVPLVYLTSSEEFMFDSIPLAALHYIIKGSANENEKLEEVLQWVISRKETTTAQSTIFSNAALDSNLPYSQITYLSQDNNTLILHTTKGNFEIDGSLDIVQASFEKANFMKSHPSYLLNIDYVDTINKNNVLLSNGESVPLDSEYSQDLKIAFSKILSSFFI